MRKGRGQEGGFSLTEVLLALGTLAVGMIFIAGVFPVGIHFTTVATERTMAAVAADEAFAMIRIIAAGPRPGDPNRPFVSIDDFSPTGSRCFETLAGEIQSAQLDLDLLAYPSLDEVSWEEKSYFWSAVCRRTRPEGPSDVQVTVFVSRKVGLARSYWFRNPNDDVLSDYDYPTAVYFKVSQVNATELEIIDFDGDDVDDETLINEGYMIVDDATGAIYRVLERYVDDSDTPGDESKIILLDRALERPDVERIWAIPAARGGIRYPCIGVYQKVVRF